MTVLHEIPRRSIGFPPPEYLKKWLLNPHSMQPDEFLSNGDTLPPVIKQYVPEGSKCECWYRQGISKYRSDLFLAFRSGSEKPILLLEAFLSQAQLEYWGGVEQIQSAYLELFDLPTLEVAVEWLKDQNNGYFYPNFTWRIVDDPQGSNSHYTYTMLFYDNSHPYNPKKYHNWDYVTFGMNDKDRRYIDPSSGELCGLISNQILLLTLSRFLTSDIGQSKIAGKGDIATPRNPEYYLWNLINVTK